MTRHPDPAVCDHYWMRRALALARQSRTHPNPMVGAILVREGKRIGAGWHQGVGTDHAETATFAAAPSEAARGATLYVTLEPCAHQNRSDGSPRFPCAERCIAAGVVRVVAAMEDPDMQVAGKGFAHLRDAGIAVTVGVEENLARELNQAYIKHRTVGLPFVTHKAAMTLDGKITGPDGAGGGITGPRARRCVHLLRGRADAVIVGVDTVLADDPRLNVRLPGNRRGNVRDPLRVVIDSRLRTPTTARLARPGTLIATIEATAANTEQQMALEATGVEIVPLPPDETGRVNVTALMKTLAARGCLDVLLESGGELAAAFWRAKLVDRVLFFIAPRIMGGRNAKTPVEGEGVGSSLAETARIETLRTRRFDPDIALEGKVAW